MKTKFKLPMLLLAVVVMMSIFYINEATKTDEPVVAPSLESTTKNPDFAEARIKSIEEVNALIEESEAKIASGKLSVAEVELETNLINSLRQTKVDEIALEEMIMSALNYEDVLVLLEEEYLIVDVYTEEELTREVFINISRLAKEKFDANYKLKLTSSTSEE